MLLILLQNYENPLALLHWQVKSNRGIDGIFFLVSHEYINKISHFAGLRQTFSCFIRAKDEIALGL